jgi:hypothetical protein
MARALTERGICLTDSLVDRKLAEVDREAHASHAGAPFASDPERVIVRRHLTEVLRALEPFALFGAMMKEKPIGNYCADDMQFYGIHTGTQWEAQITHGNLRRAAAIFTEPKEEL